MTNVACEVSVDREVEPFEDVADEAGKRRAEWRLVLGRRLGVNR